MSIPAEKRFIIELEQLKKDDCLRKFSPYVPSYMVDLSSNSYLNLHENKKIQARAHELCTHPYGALASRLVLQNSPLFEQLETTIAQWKNAETAILFNSGFTANVGIIQALTTRETAVFSDRLNHASLVDGIRISTAEHHRYQHKDVEHLAVLIAQSKRKEKFIVTDSLFSMDGDIAPLKELLTLAEKHNAFLLVDEAHASGIFGQHGGGILERENIQSPLILRMGTLSKALAGMGGYLCTSQLIKNYLINRCRPLIYSTALPESVLAWNLAAVEHIMQTENPGKNLLENATHFRKTLVNKGITVGTSESQIVPIITGTSQAAISLSHTLKKEGFYAPVIRPPTVPDKSSRIRISLHDGLTDKHYQQLLQILCNEGKV